jgi:hypothetical protein
MGMFNPSGKEDVINYHSIQIHFETFCISQWWFIYTNSTKPANVLKKRFCYNTVLWEKKSSLNIHVYILSTKLL